MAALAELDQNQQETLCSCKGFQQAVAEARGNLTDERQLDGKIFWVSHKIQLCPLPGCSVSVTVEQNHEMPAPVRRGAESAYERINVYGVEDAGCTIELDSP